MNLYPKLVARQAAGKPLRVGMIGAGKFGSMFLAQLLKLPGVHLVGVVDLSPAAAISNMKYVGWEEERFGAASLDAAAKHLTTHVGDDAKALIAHGAVDIVIECTGNPLAAVEHCLAAFSHGPIASGFGCMPIAARPGAMMARRANSP